MYVWDIRNVDGKLSQREDRSSEEVTRKDLLEEERFELKDLRGNQGS